MGVFTRKEKTVTDRIAGLKAKVEDIRRSLAIKTGHLEESRANLNARLADLALSQDDPQIMDQVKNARRSVERLTESVGDLQVMEKALTDEITKLESERLVALVAEAGPKAEEVATGFNAVLQETLKTLGSLRSQYADLLKSQAAFNSVLQERAAALQKLEMVEPMELTAGLGELALVRTPFRFTLAVPEGDLGRFIIELLGYEKKLLEYRANAEMSEDRGNNWDVGDWASFGSVGSPEYGHNKMSIPMDNNVL
jgi:hypothetical protein